MKGVKLRSIFAAIVKRSGLFYDVRDNGRVGERLRGFLDDYRRFLNREVSNEPAESP